MLKTCCPLVIILVSSIGANVYHYNLREEVRGRIPAKHLSFCDNY